MKYGAIDIGTNAARLLIGEVEDHNGVKRVRKVSYTRIPLRLGLEVFDKKKIDSKKRVEFIKTIQAFKLIAEIFEIKHLRAVATSAMREAENGWEIKEEIMRHTGVNIEIIDGDEVLHCGIAIRWIVNIKKLNANANITSLPMVTASAQFNNLSASVRFEVIGISSSEITALLPTSVDLKADTYVDLQNAFEKIKSKIIN